MDSGQAKCPMFMGCGGGAGLKWDHRKRVQVEGTAWLKNPGVEIGQPKCRTASSLVPPHIRQQASVKG